MHVGRGASRPAANAWMGRAFFAPGRMLYVGLSADASPHAHHAVQISASFAGPFRYRRGQAAWQSARVMALPADLRHEFVATPGPIALAYLEPDSATGRSIDGALRADLAGAEARLERATRGVAAPASRDEALRFLELVATSLVGDAGPPRPRHPAVTRALAFLQGAGLEAALRERDVALQVGLSPGRLSHLFAREAGLPFRPYVLWLRLEKAVGSLAEGATLAQAAHAAGFADAAHLTRTCRRMFGTPPSAIASGVAFDGPPSLRLAPPTPRRREESGASPAACRAPASRPPERSPRRR